MANVVEKKKKEAIEMLQGALIGQPSEETIDAIFTAIVQNKPEFFRYWSTREWEILEVRIVQGAAELYRKSDEKKNGEVKWLQVHHCVGNTATRTETPIGKAIRKKLREALPKN